MRLIKFEVCHYQYPLNPTMRGFVVVNGVAVSFYAEVAMTITIFYVDK